MEDDYRAYSIKEFCRRQSISRGSYYKLVKSGRAPTVMMVGDRPLITARAERKWQDMMMAYSATAPRTGRSARVKA